MRVLFRKVFNLRRMAIIARRMVASLLLIAGLTSVALLFVNPLPFLEPLFPIHYETTDLYIHIEQAHVQSWLNTFWDEAVISIGVSSSVLALGLGLISKGVLTYLKTFGRGLRASPRATLDAPVRMYRRINICRNWLLAKYEYLQSESVKWRTTFQIIKLPYTCMLKLGFSPQIALSLIFAGTAVGGGVVVNETILAERSFRAGDAGVYAAPGDTPVSYVTDPEEEGYNTLRIDLGSTPVRAITIENVSVGTVFTGSALPSGVQNVVQVGGTAAVSTRLEVGHLIFEKSRCKKLELSDIQAHTLIIRGNASDGQSIAPSPGTSRMRAIGGGHHQAEEMIHSGGTFDRIWIQAPTSGVNGKVDKLTLNNLFSKGGPCVLSRMNIGTLEVLLNEVGAGNGFATKEFTVATNVTAAVITVEDNVEVSISEPATQ